VFARPKDLWTCPESKRRSPTHCHSDAQAKRDRRNLLQTLSFRRASEARQEEPASNFVIPTRERSETGGTCFKLCHSDARAKRDRRNPLFRFSTNQSPDRSSPPPSCPFAFPHSPGVQRTRREGVPRPTPQDPFFIPRPVAPRRTKGEYNNANSPIRSSGDENLQIQRIIASPNVLQLYERARHLARAATEDVPVRSS